MHRRKIFTTVVSAGLLLLPFASAQFPGNKVENSGGGGSGADNGAFETAVREDAPSQTAIAKPASGSCKSPVQLLRLSENHPYMPVKIDEVTYNLAISFEEEGTYLFSTRFCGQTLQRADTTPCYPIAGIDGPDSDDAKDTVNTGQYNLELEYDIIPVSARVGADSDSILFENYTIRAVKDSDNGELLRSTFSDTEVHGIIGLKNSGTLIQSLASSCKQPPGWGIRLQANSFFSFGGFDSLASSIGLNDTGKVLDFTSEFTTAEINPIIVGGFAENVSFNKVVVLDTLALSNTVPSDIVASVGTLSSGASVDIVISGVTFNIPWSDLDHQGSGRTGPSGTLVLGAPFFQNVYTALFPGSRRQIPVFASYTGTEDTEFTPFSTVVPELRVPTNTRPGGGISTSSSSGSPSRKGDNTNEEPMAATPAMAKSGTNIGAIVGGVVGGVVVLLIIVIAACCFYRRKKLTKGGSPRGIEKEYEAEFDAEIGQHDGFFPQFKESGYATLPTPPPAPPGPRIPSLILGSPMDAQYDGQTEYTPTLHPYHDESPSRSLNVTPLPPPAQTPILTIPPIPERRLSVTPSLSIEPPSPLSRNVSAASRRDFPGILQMQHRTGVGAVPEEDYDNYDAVSMTSGPTYHPVQPSQEASSSAPRLPFSHRSETASSMGMTDRGAGL